MKKKDSYSILYLICVPHLIHPLLHPSAYPSSSLRHQLSLLMVATVLGLRASCGWGEEAKGFWGYWGWMRPSEHVTRAGVSAASAADSYHQSLFKNTSWHMHPHMSTPFVFLNPAIRVYMPETNTLDKHGALHVKTQIYATYKNRSFLILIGWVQQRQEGGIKVTWFMLL